MHSLTQNEMPSHNHGYSRFNYNSYTNRDPYSISGSGYYLTYHSDTTHFYCNDYTDNVGGSRPHNNMPPYITAYCWRRYR